MRAILSMLGGTIAAVAISACSTWASETGADTQLVTLDGVGPFHIGSAFADVSAEFPLKFEYSSEPFEHPTGVGCEIFSIVSQWPTVSLMFEEGILTRIDFYQTDDGKAATYLSPHGASVGMNEADVRARVHAGTGSSNHPYIGADGAYLTYLPAERPDRGIVYEIERGVLYNFRVGDANSVQYIEGCL